MASAGATPRAPGASDARDPRLDGLRGIAILWVILHHAGPRLPIEGLPGRIYTDVIEFGWTGVDLFFVLSGYLITGILLRTRGDAGYARTFYARRTLRIFPVYYAWLVFMLLVVPQLDLFARYGYFRLVPEIESAWYWLYLSNVRAGLEGGFQHTLLSLTWSLAIEEQFYLVWPWVVRALSRRSLLRLCVALFLGAFACRALLLAQGAPVLATFVWTPCRMDTLALGATIALLVQDPALHARLRRVAGVGLPLAVLAFGALAVGVRAGVFGGDSQGLLRHHPAVVTVGYSLVALLYGAVLLRVRLGPAARPILASAPLRTFGRFSYAIYLTHTFVSGMVILHVFDPSAHPGWLGALAGQALEMSAMLALGVLVWIAIERPCERWKRRFAYPGGATPPR